MNHLFPERKLNTLAQICSGTESDFLE